MDKLLKQFAYILGFTVVMIVAGCSDNIADEITTIETSRLFSPTDFKTQIIDQTSVRLTWKAISNAKSYNIEVSDNEEFAGSPVKTASVTFLEAPYTISGFAEETDYFVRIQAVAEGFTESKWASATFKTGAAPVVLLPFEASDTQVKSVTLHWTAGEAVTAILLTPGDIEHLLTSEEMAAGAATIDGLTAKTAYTAKLMNGTKIRGTLTFTTLSEGGQIITISPANNLKTILEAASNEDVFILTSGTYSSTSDDITISKSISIHRHCLTLPHAATIHSDIYQNTTYSSS
ncbi:hypothetical protein EZS27_007464 [termite gut metagenome]|uniref:Fibronectin type-III domain-containing protein n=1 Tax=termite gut metagenome TaxID=433724 RepID=A0A5J4SI60_9ZZZZ